ncbi:MAG: Ig-like domain-containing protein [Methanobrevibacter sp.]|nr:Ig-like domain-containing protein [Methanobrevibacter sp.]
MFKRTNKIFILLIACLLLVIFSYPCFASNETSVQFDDSLAQVDNAEDILSSGDNVPLGVDYYFNGSSDDSGDGSEDSPYNELTLARMKTGSTLHLANGEYNLTNGKTLTKITIIGENPEKTIIRYVGPSNAGKFSVGIDNYLLLSNVTFIGFNFDVEGGTLQANNTIFRDSQAFPTYSSATNLVNSASNSFGGAIYGYDYQSYSSTFLPAIYLDNCTFISNTGEYGGAICMDNGDLDITNSLFINNYAYNFGGAIAAFYGANVRVKNTKFINDTSINDAGGAIYLIHSTLSASNMTAINCSATFGSVVTALNSTTAISKLNAVNNTAKYDGGVIYQMYNGITIIDSYFENNRASNGGAVFVNDAEIFNLEYNTFYNNFAYQTAGAVYSLLNNKISFKDNKYTNNKANKSDDLYQTDSIILDIGNGNYTLFYNNSTFDGVIPSYYSLIDEGHVTPVRDQQSGGNCWAFSVIAALESSILKASGISYDFSEENVKNLMQKYSDYGWAGIETNDGGYDEMGISYFVNWLGPVDESIEKYDDYSMLSPVLNAITHVQNIIFLGRNTYTDNDGIKEAIMRYGAVSTGIYYDSTYFYNSKNSYYYYGSSYSNHAVAIVGWDDNYSKDNFYYKPAGDGAWIVKNSWGEDWGNKGYFYVSYYDTMLAKVGDKDYSFAFVFNSTERYDKNYQYDVAGRTDYLVTGNKTIWAQNIFKSTDNEILAGVSTYFRKTTDWDLFIYVNDQLALTQNGTSNPGYYTIELANKIPLSVGDEFRVVFKFYNSEGAEFGISERISTNKLTYAPEVSFFSLDGENWTDLYNFAFQTEVDNGHTYLSQVACIKAFTVLYELLPSVKLSATNVYNEANITATVLDQYNNLIHSGEVIFNIDGSNYTVKIENGIANLNHVFNERGLKNIVAYYKGVNSSFLLDITKLNINLGLNIQKDKNNVILTLKSPFDVNTTVILNLNNKISYVDLICGSANLVLNDLDFGEYDIKATVYDDAYASELSSGFNITISKTRIIANDLDSYYTFEKQFSVILEDIYGQPVVNRLVSFIVNGKSYAATTDEMGVATILVKLDNETTNNKVNVIFYGDERYFESNAESNIYLKPSVVLSDKVNYITKSSYEITLLDFNGNPLSVNKANLITVDGVSYWEINNNLGQISYNLNLRTGSHTIAVTNTFTGESVTHTINLVNPLMENKNINCYYLSTTYYKVKVYGSDGNVAKPGEIVTFNVNKATTKVKVGNDGYASLKINLNPGTYTITATYNGYKVSNKITVKPILITKNISTKKAKTIKFTAKLLDSKGKIVKNKKITFKVSGKTYTANTNSKGIATLSLKNLKVGTYKVITKYGKSSCTNTIKVRK